MFDREKLKNHFKIIAVFILLILIIISIYKTLSKYQSNSNSEGEIDVAFYLLKEDFQSMSLNLGNIEPRQAPYVYTFTISNNHDNKRTEVDLEYDLEIKTTTNLPLEYQLYLNENYNSNNATNIITENILERDQYNTIFRKIQTTRKQFNYTTNQSNTYNLVVYFPERFKTINYQNIIDGIIINVNSRQIID